MDFQRDSHGQSGGTLVVQVANSLREAILGGAYQPGDKLPSEARLTESHGVSRTVVREAIAALRSDGLVEPRRGAGVFVLEPVVPPGLPFQNIDHARISSIIEVLELRAAVEVEAAGLAAVRRSPAQEETILDRHRAVGQCIVDGQPTSAADFALHTAIAEATSNPRFVEFMTLMGQNAIPRAALTNNEGRSSTAYLNQLHDEHARIVTAISNGDSEGAREAMRAHLLGSQRRYRALLQKS
ncbi:FadR/GntR family transcriptional regulator [Pelagibacterium luteolum]|uniref:DNA-binding transcriptional regulator, FadR family n=1 Tax=Pelagibacterium luteolum TaxID=440168 RepID=A0A1G7XRT5_9HYPH|nr:FadR/GntR family transcriptional regulator [Pelagibacterium luteolum]SDG86909.1 DNA-binding transcriptional regulator, FadR family [Pelagibacterium luteolum]